MHQVLRGSKGSRTTDTSSFPRVLLCPTGFFWHESFEAPVLLWAQCLFSLQMMHSTMARKEVYPCKLSRNVKHNNKNDSYSPPSENIILSHIITDDPITEYTDHRKLPNSQLSQLEQFIRIFKGECLRRVCRKAETRGPTSMGSWR